MMIREKRKKKEKKTKKKIKRQSFKSKQTNNGSKRKPTCGLKGSKNAHVFLFTQYLDAPGNAEET